MRKRRPKISYEIFNKEALENLKTLGNSAWVDNGKNTKPPTEDQPQYRSSILTVSLKKIVLKIYSIELVGGEKAFGGIVFIDHGEDSFVMPPVKLSDSYSAIECVINSSLQQLMLYYSTSNEFDKYLDIYGDALHSYKGLHWLNKAFNARSHRKRSSAISNFFRCSGYHKNRARLWFIELSNYNISNIPGHERMLENCYDSIVAA